MQEYKVIARKYRPKKFNEVIGQDPIVSTLKNSIRLKRVPHAFLFSGGRGIGKTTLARLLAKALNCSNLSEDVEPCNECPSCKDINSGSSINVLEIDGASHRGIDDIRRITETVGYSTTEGNCKVYIIDEVHMLTKEAFNALLKTLEEPPINVKFVFATTESHKVPKTILSRCQHFHLNQIPSSFIVKKLTEISQDSNREITEGALRCLAEMAEGGLRDAESLLDQTLSFQEGIIDEAALHGLFGWMDKETLFILDRAGKAGNFKAAFEISEELFSNSKDLSHFLDDLINHFRILTKLHLGFSLDALNLSQDLKLKYRDTLSLYSKEQVIELFEMIVKAPEEMRFHPEPRIALEALLLRILRSHFQIPIDFLIKKLSELEAIPTTSQNIPTEIPREKLSHAVPQDLFAPKEKISEIKPKPLPPQAPPIKAKEAPSSPPEPLKALGQKEETMIQFAAIELEGTLKRN